MGCLSMHIERVGGDCNVTANRVGGDCRLSAERIGGDCRLSTERVGGDCRLSTERVGGLKMSILFVCDVGRQEYIRVTPEEPMWIVVGEDLTYRIRSNTGWLIE